MHEVCVGHGWCGAVINGKATHVDDFIPETGSVSADQFVDWLLMADGVDPVEEQGRWADQRSILKAAFISHMGSAVVDASRLKWDR